MPSTKKPRTRRLSPPAPASTSATKAAESSSKLPAAQLAVLVDPADAEFAAQIQAQLAKAQRVAVVGHERPDGDCMGSTIALGDILRQLGHNTVVALDSVPDRFAYLHRQKWVRVAKKGRGGALGEVLLSPKPDLIFVLDTTDPGRVGGVRLDRYDGALVVNIDHHISNQCFGEINWVDSKAAAAGELIWRLAAACQWTVPPLAKDALYTALVTDTGQFAYSNTTARVMRMAADLIETGVDPEDLWRRIYLNKTRAEMELEARVRSSMQTWAQGAICAVSLTQKDFDQTKTTPELTQEFPGIPRALAGAQLALFFYAVKGGKATKVSIRSVKEIDACALAQQFGGGGHRQAAGCSIPLAVKEAMKLFKPAALAALRKSKAKGTRKTPAKKA